MDVLSILSASCRLVCISRERQAARALAVTDFDSSEAASSEAVASLYRAADRITAECGVRLDLLALDCDGLCDLVDDECGNDAKEILQSGVMARGRKPDVRGSVAPPNPSRMTDAEIEYNMHLHGFDLMGTGRAIQETAVARPEYVVAAAMFGMHTRRISSGIPVLLCHAEINYGLLLYVARSYGFAGRLLGVMSEIRAAGRLAGVVDGPISILQQCGTIPRMPFTGSVREALDVYAC